MRDLNSLFHEVKAFDRPPVEKWHPEKTVDFDLHITSNGDWVHEGDKITRHKLVKLFSTVLALRDGEHFLVTPPVKYRIQVEDAPFLAVELRAVGLGEDTELVFRTNVDEVVTAGPKHPIEVEVERETGEPNPYIFVRDGLKARLTRSVFYQLVDIALSQGADESRPGVTSGKTFFPLT
ncbi:MAG: DUF1285 domain-containing protein [Acidiferrobacterales bacterium]|nr:DUF1285 domain-containing protein [Acidiferrobacterales bacterium]